MVGQREGEGMGMGKRRGDVGAGAFMRGTGDVIWSVRDCKDGVDAGGE